ncbi:MAG: signal peptidase II [Bacteroidota bacterium]
MLNNKWFKYGFFIAIIFACVSCDQHTKQLAKEQLAYAEPISYLDGAFVLIYAENTGAFLGLGDSLSPNLKYLFLIFIPTLVLFLFAATYFKTSANLWQFIGMSLIVAGGIGNLIDRIAYGSVVDFMNIGIGDLRTGIFNVADIAVSVGLTLLLIGIYRPK